MKKIIKNPIFTLILGLIISGSIGVLAYSIKAEEIGYTPKDKSWSVSNVREAIDDLKTNPSGAGNINLSGGKYILSDLPEPTRDGYRFAGWYTDSELTNKASSDLLVSSSTKLYAKWVEAGTIYVSAKGSDSGEGTKSSPYKTISKAINSAESGYTIRIGEGEYQLTPMEGRDVASGDGIYDNNKKITIIGENEKTVLKYDGALSTKRDANAISLKNSESVMRNLVYEYKPGKSNNYSNALFAWTNGSVYNVFFRITGSTAASYLYYNSQSGKNNIVNCTFFHDLEKVTSNYSGNANYVNTATNVNTNPTSTTTVVNKFGNSSMTTQELITASKNLSAFSNVGVYNGTYSWK